MARKSKRHTPKNVSVSRAHDEKSAKSANSSKSAKFASNKSHRSISSNPVAILDQFLHVHSKWALAIIASLFLIIGLGLFDAYIVPMADDATYITQPLDLIQKGIYPTYTSVFYTVVMAIPAALFGVNILAFKAMSFIFGAAGIILFYGFFKNRLPASVLFATLFIYATNYEIQFYNSALMSESFFMAFQVVFFGLALTIIDRFSDQKNSDQKNSASNADPRISDSNISTSTDLKAEITQRWVFWATTGLLFVLFSVTKNQALISALILALFFAIHKRFKIALFITGLFMIFRALYSFAIDAIFGATTVTGQFDTLLLKNMYDPSQGNEDLLGMVIRYGQNFNYYISDVLLRYLGIRADGVTLEPLGLFSIAFALLSVFFVIRSYKKNDYLTTFTGLYLMGMMSVVFISLQFHWKQDRQLIIFLPLIVLFVFNAFHHLARQKRSSLLNWGLLVLLVGIPMLQLRHLPDRWERNAEKREAFLNGDPIGGYTPDWQNYYRMSNWAVENLPEGSRIGVRKAATSFVFTGGKDQFIRIGASTKEPGDVVLQELRELGITHFMPCSLRLDPDAAVEGQIIGTLYSYLRAIYAHKPDAIRLVHTIETPVQTSPLASGQFRSASSLPEPCYLYEIVYE